MVRKLAWMFAVVQIPADPSRHRVAVWRELRRAGAVVVSQGTWALPDVDPARAALQRASELATAGGGTVAVFAVRALDEASAGFVERAYRSAREDEWNEFEADCGKFEAEIAKEIAREKLTFAELEEEEQSLDRLRRWYRDLKRRDVLALPAAERASERLATCSRALDGYAELVYRANRSDASA